MPDVATYDEQHGYVRQNVPQMREESAEDLYQIVMPFVRNAMKSKGLSFGTAQAIAEAVHLGCLEVAARQ